MNNALIIKMHCSKCSKMANVRTASNKIKLKRQLKPMHVWAVAFGCVIGWGSFINPGKKFLPNSGVAGTAIAMLSGALVMMIIAASYAYMVPKFPEAGGEFTFAKKCFGRIAAYSCGWFLVAAYLSNIPMNATAIGLVVDGLDGDLDILKFGFHYQIAGFDVWMGEMLLAIGILILFGCLNIWGVKKAGFIQTVLSVTLAFSTITLCVATCLSKEVTANNMNPIWGFDKSAVITWGATTEKVNLFAHVGSQGIMSAIFSTFAIAPWAFVGFDTIPQTAEEFAFPYKRTMLIMVVAILFGCFVYIANNTVAAAALENWPERVIAGDWVLLIAAEELLGVYGKLLIGIGVSCAVLSGIMGFYLASSRLMYAMSRDGFLPKWFSIIDQKHGTPKNAMIFCVVISLSGPILGREALSWFVDMSAIGASIGYFFTCAATLKTQKCCGDGGAVLKILATAGLMFSLIFIFLQLIPIPFFSNVHFEKESYIMLLIWTVIGISFYEINRKYMC